MFYYTSECDESQNLTITIEDNLGKSFKWKVDLNNDTLNTVKGDIYQ
ncbi:TraQ conjugal transfer family protein [Phocaeicola sp.]|jgi:C4-type Zn-finger protein